MKFQVFCLVLVAMFLIGCADDAPTATNNCPALMADMQAAGTTFNEAVTNLTATEAQCDANAAALQAYVDGGCDTAGDFDQATITAMAENCSLYGE